MWSCRGPLKEQVMLESLNLPDGQKSSRKELLCVKQAAGTERDGGRGEEEDDRRGSSGLISHQSVLTLMCLLSVCPRQKTLRSSVSVLQQLRLRRTGRIKSHQIS